MNHPISSVTETLLSMMPVVAISLFAGMAWYFFCLFLMRRQDAAWHASLPLVPVADHGGSFDVQIKDAELRLACLKVRAYAIGRGSPSVRLFVFGLLAAFVIAVAAFLLTMI